MDECVDHYALSAHMAYLIFQWADYENFDAPLMQCEHNIADY